MGITTPHHKENKLATNAIMGLRLGWNLWINDLI
jgi:hypothetical protein